MNDPRPIPLARPAIGDAEAAAQDNALRSGRLVLGPENARLEALLAVRCGRRHAIAVSSGTMALDLSLWAIGIAPGDEVLIPAFGFPAAANLVAARGAVPVACDVSLDTWTLDLEAAAAAATPRCRAVVSIDQLGLVAEAAPLVSFCQVLGATLIDDAACGLGGRDSAGVPGGGCGALAILSFHPRKVITTGEGGAVLCDDDALEVVVRSLRNHGQVAPGVFARVGTNARLGEPAAAVGCAQLARLDAMLEERALLAAGYRERLAMQRERGRLSWQEVPAGGAHAYQTFAVLLEAGIKRDLVRARLAADGVESGPATYAFHRLPSLAAAAARAPLPVADALHDRALALPLFIGMRSAELNRVCLSLARALA